MLGGVVLAVAALAVSGCAPVTACTAIGWTNTLEVRTVSVPGSVASVGVCVAADCATGDASGIVPDPAGTGVLRIAQTATNLWTVEFGMTAPAAVGLTAIDRSSATLAVTTVDLVWTRVGGSERCGGPMRAGPVDFAVD